MQHHIPSAVGTRERPAARGAGATGAHAQRSGDRLLRVAAALVIAAAAAFVLLTAIAMLTYPGGNARDEAAPGYAPALNFFSDLGATRSYGGAVNWISLGLFGAALAFVGVALIVLGCSIVRLGHRRRPERWALLPAPVFAGVAGACFIGIAATPWDIALTPHMVFVTLGFLAVTLFSVSLLTLQLVQRWSAAFWVPNAACVVVLITYEVVMCVYASTTLPEGLEVQVIGQKVVVYASTVNLAWQAVGVLKRRPARSARRERSAQADR